MSAEPVTRLELDVGNTRIKWRLKESGKVVQTGLDLRAEVGFDVHPPAWVNRVEQVWVSSVHQQQDQWLKTLFPMVRYAKSKRTQCGLVNSYEDPSKMGVDRWLAMLAAREMDQVSAHVVVDAGTAITLDIIDSVGQHVGGYICPGISMMKTALLGGTNQVKAETDWVLGREPGKNTQTCVDHGIQDMVLSWLESHIQQAPDALVSISGGNGAMLSELLGMKNNYHPDLVLDGLNLSLRDE